jgi:hypothetical protein
MSIISGIAAKVAAVFNRARNGQITTQAQEAWKFRQAAYGRWAAMYDGSIYRGRTTGGLREQCLRELLGNDADISAARLHLHYNPMPAIVDAYQNAFWGMWGSDICLDTSAEGCSCSDQFITEDPVGNIWKWSGLDTSKQLLSHLAAGMGTVGLRVTAIDNVDSGLRRAIVQVDHPSKILDYEADSQGNITAVQLRYETLFGTAEDQRSVQIDELFTEEEIIRTVDGKEVYRAPNELGICPYVIILHRDDGSLWGQPAHRGLDDVVHRINYLISLQGDGIADHIYPTWFASAAGDAPKTIDVGRNKLAYVKTAQGDPTPTLEPIVPQIDHSAAAGWINDRKEELAASHPEMILSNLKALSGQSGETIAQLTKPAATRILSARVQYEAGLRRALQIAGAMGVQIGLWDLGTGKGTPDAAKRAMREGVMDFVFTRRPALAPDLFEQAMMIENRTAEKAARITMAAAALPFVSTAEAQRLAGYTPEEMKTINDERAAQDVIPTLPQ